MWPKPWRKPRSARKTAEANRRKRVQEQEADAVQGENLANANIADYNAELEVKRAAALQQAEVAKYDAQVAIQQASVSRQSKNACAPLEVVREEIEKNKVEIAAEAEAERCAS